jgi:hypothetical protein
LLLTVCLRHWRSERANEFRKGMLLLHTCSCFPWQDRNHSHH